MTKTKAVTLTLPFMVACVGAGMSGRQNKRSRYTNESPFCLTATTETKRSQINNFVVIVKLYIF